MQDKTRHQKSQDNDIHYDTNVEITKTTQENQNTKADLQPMRANIQTRQNGGIPKLKVCKLQ